MPFLQETPRTLRIYFTLVGLLGIAANLDVLLNRTGGVIALLSLLSLAFAVAYIYLGVRFSEILATAPRRITSVLIAAGAYLLLLFIVYAFLGVPIETFARPVVGLVFTWYLIVNVRRLARGATPADRSHQPHSIV